MNSFAPEALADNRRGALTAAQRDGLTRALRGRNRRATVVAAVLFAAALLVGLLAPAALALVWRIAIVGVALGIAVSLILRILTGGDRALKNDLRLGQVQCVTGPITQEQESAMDVESTSVYFLKVGDERILVSQRVSEAAPRSGQVRLYYLAESRRFINFEPVLEGAVPPVVAQRPLREAIVGSWRNNFASVTFAAEGSVTASVMGRRSTGEWSVDADGRLHAQIAGRQEVAEACIEGDELRVTLAGRAVTLTREARLP